MQDPFLRKFRNSVPKVCITTPIHVLRSNFTEIDHREVGETMRCLSDKKFARCPFAAPFCAGSTEGAKIWRGSCHVTLCLSLKFRRSRWRLPELFQKNWFCTNTVYGFGI